MVGFCEGFLEGISVGGADGNRLGSTEGGTKGTFEGSLVGRFVGSCVLGSFVVSASVGMVGDVVGSFICVEIGVGCLVVGLLVGGNEVEAPRCSSTRRRLLVLSTGIMCFGGKMDPPRMA